MYKIVIYGSRMPLPIHFAYHTWVTIEVDKQVTRFDVFGFKDDKKGKRIGHLHKNYHKSNKGCPLFAIGSYRFFPEIFYWKSEVFYVFEGDEKSNVAQLCNQIMNNPHFYPYCDTYKMIPGPNSNTFTQWILNKLTQNKKRLPSGCIGSNYTQ